MAKKKVRGIRFSAEDELFILMHCARTGVYFQDFVAYAIKKEIKFLQDNRKKMDERLSNKLNP